MLIIKAHILLGEHFQEDKTDLQEIRAGLHRLTGECTIRKVLYVNIVKPTLTS